MLERIDGGAVSANLLGECMYHDPTGSQNKRNVGDGPQDVKPKVVFLARRKFGRDHHQQRQAVL
jgi:hypothetical protein